MADDTKPPRRGRPKTFNNNHVLDVAIDCYWREGPDNVSLNAICRRAGVSKPGIYREFGNEDGLMAAALQHYAQTELAPILAHTQTDEPFTEALDKIITRLTFTDENTPPGCLFTRLRSAAGRLGPKTQAAIHTLREDAIVGYTGWVERAKTRGDIDPNISTPLVAHFIDLQFTNVLAQMAAGDEPEILRAQIWLAFKGLLR